MQKRSNIPPVRVTQQQREVIEKAARLVGKSISGFSRSVVVAAAKNVVKAYEKKGEGK